MSERKYADGSTYEEGSEAVLMAVWYAMKWATKVEEMNRSWIRSHPQHKWWVLNQMKQRLGMKNATINYRAARHELVTFAREYGVIEDRKRS